MRINDEIAKEDQKTKTKIMKADRVIQDVKYTIGKMNSERSVKDDKKKK